MRVSHTSHLQPDGTTNPPVTRDPPLPPGYEEPLVELSPEAPMRSDDGPLADGAAKGGNASATSATQGND